MFISKVKVFVGLIATLSVLGITINQLINSILLVIDSMILFSIIGFRLFVVFVLMICFFSAYKHTEEIML